MIDDNFNDNRETYRIVREGRVKKKRTDCIMKPTSAAPLAPRRSSGSSVNSLHHQIDSKPFFK